MKLRVLELYSGIGGMHYALKESQTEFEIVLAIDINTTANEVYRYNFPDTNLQSFGIEKLNLKLLNSLHIDAILMSPPCQPFTRVGKKRDCHDVRTKSFLHVLHLIKEIKAKPRYILVENVKGFECSETRSKLVECLQQCNYTYQEFLLTPLQFGIPNSRLRYYLTAKWSREILRLDNYKILNDLRGQVKEEDFETSLCTNEHSEYSNGSKYFTSECVEKLNTDQSAIQEKLQCDADSYSERLFKQCTPTLESYSSSSVLDGSSQIIPGTECTLKEVGRNMRYCEEDDKYINDKSHSLSEYTEKGEEVDFQEYWLTDKELRMFIIMDVVYPELKKSICFTKRYGHYVEGAGSVVLMSSNVEHLKAASDLKHHAVNSLNRHEWGEHEMEILRNLHLRYFTPREVANLLCFPKEFNFPEGLTKVQKYRVLGNSLNVYVVAQLIKFMTKSL
ncbi:tRNA (cytosine-5-)-methyltransferase [Bulinus truncatus]|nr:tRNA (cytosine-5-)-methyltransferase [Bulinus truncatus]